MSHLCGEKKALQGTKEQPSGTHKEAIKRTEMGCVGGGSLGDNRLSWNKRSSEWVRGKTFFNHLDSQSVEQVVQRGLQFS